MLGFGARAPSVVGVNIIWRRPQIFCLDTFHGVVAPSIVDDVS